MTDSTTSSVVKSRIIGFFEFLHRVNYGLIRQATRSSAHVDGYLHSRHPDGLPRDVFHHIQFLNAFELGVSWHETPSVGIVSTFPLPSPGQIDDLIREDIEAVLGRSIFYDAEALRNAIDRSPSDTVRIVTTNGCFDVLHPGHIRTLTEARQQGDLLIVLINSDASVRRFKGDSRPIHDECFRALILSKLHAVDYVLIFDDDTPIRTLTALRPCIHVKGGSFIEDRVRAERELLSHWNGELLQIPMLSNYSTSAILAQYGLDMFPV